MGMFDNINCADALPCSEEMVELGLNVNNRSFQTKDLDNCLDTYTIQGGKLYTTKYKTEKWIEGNPKSEVFSKRFGYIEREEPYEEQILHHGEIFFYDFIYDVQGKWDCWVEFKAVFTNGVIDKIVLFEFRKTDNTERKTREEEFKKQLHREANIWYNKYILNTTSVRWVLRKLSRLLYSIGSFITTLSYKI